MELIKGLILYAKLTGRDIECSLSDEEARFDIGDVNVTIYQWNDNRILVSICSEDLQYESFKTDGRLEPIFKTIISIIKNLEDDDEMLYEN